MHTIESYETGRKSSFPSSWDEMSPKQICFAYREFEKVCQEKISLLEYNIIMLFYFLGIKPKRPKGQAAENVYYICERCLGFLLSEDNGTVSLAFKSVENPLPRIGKLHGPLTLLQDLTFGEFRHATMFMTAFAKSRNVEDLDDCVAALYRRKAKSFNRAGRRAASLDSEDYRKDLRVVSRMAAWQKNLILQWFCNCLQHIQGGQIILDGEDVDLSLLFSNGGEASGALSCTWNDLLVQIAKDQTIGNIERVDEEPLFSVLRIMWSNYKEAKRYEKTAKANQTK